MTRDEVAADAAAALDDRVTRTLEHQARFAIAVPGGSVATTLFPRFAELPVVWPRVDITFVDERLVSPSDPDSNLGRARSHWIDRLGAVRPRVIAPPVDDGDATVVAERWQTALIETLGTPPRLDLAVLGMGPDGHVASLFPGHALLDRRGAWAAGLTDSPKPPPARVTLTLDALRAAREIWVVAFGREKAAAVDDARNNPGSRLPVAIVARAAPRVTWYLDDAASGS